MKPKYSMSAAIKEANKRVFISYSGGDFDNIEVMLYKEHIDATTVVASLHYAKSAKRFMKLLRVSVALELYAKKNELTELYHTIPPSFITDLIIMERLRGITAKSRPFAIAKAILDQGFCTIPHLSLN